MRSRRQRDPTAFCRARDGVAGLRICVLGASRLGGHAGKLQLRQSVLNLNQPSISFRWPIMQNTLPM